MNGIQYLTDERGRRVAVQIDLRKHGSLWEDIQDTIVANARRKEKSVSLDEVIISACHAERLLAMLARYSWLGS